MVRRACRSSCPSWIIYFARIGQLAKGIIFISIGLLSAHAAWLGQAEASGSRGALRSVAAQPFGRALLLVLIAGLVCYVLWLLLEVVADVNAQGRDFRGLLLRARSLGVAVIYSGLTAGALKILLGASSSDDGNSAAQDWTQQALQAPLGGWLVIAIGLGVSAGGLFLIFQAVRRNFEKKLDLSPLAERTRRWVLRICVFGLCARGIVFVLIGVFLIQAGMESNAGKARGLGGALQALRAQPYGTALFLIVAAGLAAYGCYSCLRARYGRWGEHG